MSAARHITSGHADDDSGFRLPRRYIDRLDADGTVRGKTWRHFLYGGVNYTLAALSWWLWKNQLPADREPDMEGQPEP